MPVALPAFRTRAVTESRSPAETVVGASSRGTANSAPADVAHASSTVVEAPRSSDTHSESTGRWSAFSVTSSVTRSQPTFSTRAVRRTVSPAVTGAFVPATVTSSAREGMSDLTVTVVASVAAFPAASVTVSDAV